MDQIKIGEFIARKRKEQELTQMQFAEAVGVSNKTVSKWETGLRMPDVSILQNVCDVLKITINELLAGEDFSEYSEKEYMKKAEDNVIGLMQEVNEVKESKWGGLLGILCGIPIMIGAVILAMIHLVGVENIPYFFNAPLILYMTGLFLFILGVTGAFPQYIAGYKCLLKIRKYSESEMDKIICTLEYVRKMTWVIGFFLCIINVIEVSLNFTHIEVIGPFLAGAVISPLYTVIIEFIHSFILYKCRLAMTDMKHGNEERCGVAKGR